MTTEVWIDGYYKQTLEIIPDKNRLQSAQKSRLIQKLHQYNPPDHRTDVSGISPHHIGTIIDCGDGITKISTPCPICFKGTENSRPRFSSTLNVPLSIPHKIGEIATIKLPGYGFDVAPLYVRNIGL